MAPTENGAADDTNLVTAGTETNLETAAVEVAAAEPALSSREIQIREIAARRQAERDAEAGDPPPAADAQAAVQNEPSPSAPPSRWIERDGQRFTKLTVYGKEREVSEDELLRIAQKSDAAEQRMRQAAEQETRLAAFDQNLRLREQRLQQAPPPAAAQAVAAESFKPFVEAVMDGRSEEAAELFNKMIPGRQQTTPAVDVGTIAAEVQERLRRQADAIAAQKQAVDAQEAIDALHTEFPDIAKNPSQLARWNLETDLIMQADPTQPAIEVMRKAARVLVPQKQAIGQSQREARKGALPTPVVGAKSAPMGTPPAPPPTHGDKIARMRAARGLPSI